MSTKGYFILSDSVEISSNLTRGWWLLYNSKVFSEQVQKYSYIVSKDQFNRCSWIKSPTLCTCANVLGKLCSLSATITQARPRCVFCIRVADTQRTHVYRLRFIPDSWPGQITFYPPTRAFTDNIWAAWPNGICCAKTVPQYFVSASSFWCCHDRFMISYTRFIGIIVPYLDSRPLCVNDDNFIE